MCYSLFPKATIGMVPIWPWYIAVRISRSRLESLEKDVSLIKEEMFRTRIEFWEDMGQLRREMNERFDRMNERFDQVHHQMVVQTRWLVGSLTLIGTAISVLLAIAQFTP